jgi:hypothetical protein
MLARCAEAARSASASGRACHAGNEPRNVRVGVRGVLIYCADYRCRHSIAISGDQWADEVRLSDLQAGFVCSVCGKRGADVRPDFNWNRRPRATMGYR